MLNLKTIAIYSSLTLLTLVWWWAAFHSSLEAPHQSQILYREPAPCPLFECISPLKRIELKAALQGDFKLMTKLIGAWDIDAQIMQSYGSVSAQRLSSETFLESQKNGRSITFSSKIKDGNTLKFLPQTYISASFMMALVSPDQIVAIPKGLRKLTSIYSEQMMASIPYDIDRYHTESLHRAHPDYAFVSHYSDPSTVQTLRDQGINLIFHKSVGSLEELQEVILSTGHIANKTKEASLMAAFIYAALFNMDNRLQVLQANKAMPKVIFVDYFGNMSIPTEKTLKGILLHRLGINANLNASSDYYSIPFTREDLINCNPDILILCSNESSGLKQQLLKDPALKHVNAVKSDQIYTVDPDLQDSPTQYLVLAYYDLYRILERALQP